MGYGIALYNVQTQRALCLHFGLALLMQCFTNTQEREKKPLSTDRVSVLRSNFRVTNESIDEQEMAGMER